MAHSTHAFAPGDRVRFVGFLALIGVDEPGGPLCGTVLEIVPTRPPRYLPPAALVRWDGLQQGEFSWIEVGSLGPEGAPATETARREGADLQAVDSPSPR